MKASKAVILLAALACLASCSLRINRQTPYRWDIRGSIVSVTDDALVVRHKTGQRVLLIIDPGTEILIGGQPAPRTALVIGKRIAVDVETDAAGVSKARRVLMRR